RYSIPVLRVLCCASTSSIIYRLSLHAALPISRRRLGGGWHGGYAHARLARSRQHGCHHPGRWHGRAILQREPGIAGLLQPAPRRDRKSTRLNSSHVKISYAVFCWKKKK